MSLSRINRNPGNRQLRQFAALLVLVAAIGLGSALRHPPFEWTAKNVVAATALGIGLLGTAAPAVVRPVWTTWMIAVYPVSWVVSNAAMAATYYLVATPLGLLMRLVGYDPMQREWDRSRPSYWTPHDTTQDRRRYFRQF